jgi:hypothetical protein
MTAKNLKENFYRPSSKQNSIVRISDPEDKILDGFNHSTASFGGQQ